MHGWLIIDKPLGLSSAQVVGKVKWLLGLKKLKLKIGHAGTLDPLATGLLPLAIGEATKVVQFLSDADKEYEFEVTWGEERSTDDAEGAVVASCEIRVLREEIEEVMKNFMGEIEQIPPQHSAIKVDGKRAYALAREQKAGSSEQIKLKSRKITIHKFELLKHSAHSSLFPAHCSKGTYIRSIARDMGRMLGCFGYVSALRRVAHGQFELRRAISLEKLEEMCEKGEEQAAILPLDEVLDDIPVLKLSDQEAQQIRNGIVIKTVLQDIPCIRLYHDNILVAIAEIHDGLLKSKRVFNL
jgi:tRNA pseudouridine55 synthase